MTDPQMENFDADAFDEWMSSGTARRGEVVLYGNLPLVDEYLEVQAELEALGDKSAPVTINQRDPRGALQERLADIEARLEESRSVWQVRALGTEEMVEIDNRYPVPVVPSAVGLKQSDAEWEVYERRFQAFRIKHEACELERKLAYVHHGVTKVVTAKGERPGVTVDQLRKMHDAPGGRLRLQMLRDAVVNASTKQVSVPRPTSPGESGSDRA
jgi:hypothetical protein